MPVNVKIKKYQHDPGTRNVRHDLPLVDDVQKAQTVGELIEHLRKFDPDLPVVTREHGGYDYSIRGREFNEDRKLLDESDDLFVCGPFILF